MFVGLLSWFTTSSITSWIKWGTILTLSLSLLGAVGYTVHLIQRDAVNQMKIEIQQQTIDDLGKQIKILQSIAMISEKVANQSRDQIITLEKEIDRKYENLGVDSQKQAPESLKELFRRMQQ